MFKLRRKKESNIQQVPTKSNEEILKELKLKTAGKAFKRYNEAGLLENIDVDYVKDVKQFWEKNYGKGIDPIFHLAFMNFTGKKDVNLVSPNLMSNDFVPFFNDPKMRGVYKDKNLYDKLIRARAPRAVENIVKRIYGTYYDKNDKAITIEEVQSVLLKYNEELIIKPSNTNNGEGINKLKVENSEMYIGGEKTTLVDLERQYGGHFVIQGLIKQHPLIAAPHPESVNTLRMVTFRWKNEIRHILTFARFGANNSVQDNAGAGGVCLGVKDNGEFYETAIDENCNQYTHHPTTGYCFADMEPIPNYDEFRKYVTELHEDILHHDFVSWDIAVGVDGQPVFLEVNLRGATWLYQLAAQKPLFGDLTQEIIEHIAKEQENENSPRKKVLTEQQKKEKIIKKQKKKIKELEAEIKSLNKELDKRK